MFSPLAIIILTVLILIGTIAITIVCIIARHNFKQKSQLALKDAVIQEHTITTHMLVDALNFNVKLLLDTQAMLLQDLHQRQNSDETKEIISLQEIICKAMQYFTNTFDDDYKHSMSIQEWLEQLLCMYQLQRQIKYQISVTTMLDTLLDKSSKVLLLKTLQDVIYPIIRWLGPSWIQIHISVESNQCKVSLEYTPSEFIRQPWQKYVNLPLLHLRMQQLQAVFQNGLSSQYLGLHMYMPLKTSKDLFNKILYN